MNEIELEQRAQRIEARMKSFIEDHNGLCRELGEEAACEMMANELDISISDYRDMVLAAKRGIEHSVNRTC